ncbi:MAG: hypothetical protein KAJ62_05955 [Desulfobacteraceae bacterium]|nr:hypothetical protein [Desulfobacteraceae bacterium]
MNIPEDIGTIPPKDKDSFNIALFFKTYCMICIPLSFLAILLLGPLKGLLVVLSVSFVLTLFVMFIAEKFSGVAKILYGGREKIFSIREQSKSMLRTAKLARRGKDYIKAIAIVDKILQQDPRFYEAMLVKAEILHEGFIKTDSAKKYLREIMKNTLPDENIHIWASAFYEKLEKNTE